MRGDGVWDRNDPGAVDTVIKQSVGLGILFPTKHALDELANDGYDLNDARNAIRKGKLVAIEGRRYRWHGPPVDDPSRTIELVLEIDAGQAVTIVTAMHIENVDHRRRARE
jgi:hypothetical protein